MAFAIGTDPANTKTQEQMERQIMRKIILSTMMLAAFSGVAQAHPDHGMAMGFAHGFMHPLSGWDHIIAMIAVGFFAATLGGRARFFVPASFVSMMVAGGVWALAGFSLPFVEAGILISVMVLSGVALLRWNASFYAAIALCGFFAVFHGFAHGLEMPRDANGQTYALGFMMATGILHVLGLVIGAAANKYVPKFA
jgi:urease accessory protein